MKEASQVVLINEKGLVLAVSRKTNHKDFGLPGGKVDPGETPEQAAIRETKEETGLDITNLRLIFAMHRDGYMGYTYLADYSGIINYDESKETHVVQWHPFQVIINGSFGEFNSLVSKSLDSLEIKYQKQIPLHPIIAELKEFIESTIRKGYSKPFKFEDLMANGYVFIEGDYNEEFYDHDEEYEKKLEEIGEKYNLPNVKFPYFYWMK